MKVSVKKIGACRKTMKVEIPAQHVAQERAELLKYYAKGVSLPGFRRGHAPGELVEKKFAKEMTTDLKDRLVPKYYHEAIDQEGLQVVSILEVGEPTLAKGKPLEFEVTLDVAPKFKVPKYRGIPLRGEKKDVEEKEVEETLESIRRQHQTFEEFTDRPAQEKDRVQVSYEANIDGEPLEEKVPNARGLGKGNGYWITCDDESFLPGMGQALIGTSIGDEKELSIEFPEGFIVEELATLKANFKVQVTGMRESKIPEFDEEFLKQLRVESEEELRKNIRQHLEDASVKKEDARQQDEVCKFLLNKVKMDVPETAVQQQTGNMMYEMARVRMMQGMSKEELALQSKEMMEEAKVKAEEQVKLRYIMLRIAEAESITVDNQEVSDEIVRMAVQQGRDAAEVRSELEKEGVIESVREQLCVGTTISLLVDLAKVK